MKIRKSYSSHHFQFPYLTFTTFHSYRFSADFHYHKFSFSFEKIEKSYLVFDVGRWESRETVDILLNKQSVGGEISGLTHGLGWMKINT